MKYGKVIGDAPNITTDERSIWDMTRIYKPPDAAKFAAELSKKRYYGLTFKWILRIVEDELNNLREESA